MNNTTQHPKTNYQKLCSICHQPFKTHYSRKEMCSFECRKIAQLDNSKRTMRKKRHWYLEESKRFCIVCGFSETTDIHHERGETYILCPNHHALITRNIKTLKDLRLMTIRKEERRKGSFWPNKNVIIVK